MPRLAAIVLSVLGWVVLGVGASPSAGQEKPSRDGPTWKAQTAPIIGGPALEFDPPEVDFGDLRPGVRVERTVMVTNTGETPVTLGSVESTCWCAAGSLSQSTLGPHESATLSVSLESGDLVTTVTRRVELIAEGYSQSAGVMLRADVHYGIRPRLMLDEGSFRTGTVTLESVEGEPFRVLSADGATPVFADGFDPEKDAPRARYSIRYDRSDIERVPRWFIVETDREGSPVIDVPSPDWAVERVRTGWAIVEPRVMLGVMGGGAREEFTVTLRGAVGDPLEFIESVRVEPGSMLRAEILGMKEVDGELRVRLSVVPREGALGLAVGALVIRAGGAEGSTVLMGRVVSEERKD